MNKVTRQAALVDLLRSVYPDSRTASEMAADLDVSVRTIERDLAELQSAGATITPERGRKGGYTYGDVSSVLVVLPRREVIALICYAAHAQSPAVQRAITRFKQSL